MPEGTVLWQVGACLLGKHCRASWRVVTADCSGSGRTSRRRTSLQPYKSAKQLARTIVRRCRFRCDLESDKGLPCLSPSGAIRRHSAARAGGQNRSPARSMQYYLAPSIARDSLGCALTSYSPCWRPPRLRPVRAGVAPRGLPCNESSTCMQAEWSGAGPRGPLPSLPAPAGAQRRWRLPPLSVGSNSSAPLPPFLPLAQALPRRAWLGRTAARPAA